MKLALRLLLIGCTFTSTARADEPPPPSVAQKAGGLLVQVNVEANVSADKVFKPVSIAPDVSYGLTSDLTVSLIHSTVGTTGFRGGTGRGICVTGTDNGCGGGLYNNAGVEALFAPLHGMVAAGLVAGFYVNPGAATSAAPNGYDVKLGAKAKLTAGALALSFNPSVFIATNRRDATPPNPDLLYLPLGVTYKVAQPFTAGLGTGVFSLDISNFSSNFSIPLGVNGMYAIDPHLAVGGSFTFAKLTGASALRDATPAAVGADFRGVHVWLNYTR